jgi:hypothetical protein
MKYKENNILLYDMNNFNQYTFVPATSREDQLSFIIFFFCKEKLSSLIEQVSQKTHLKIIQFSTYIILM